MINIAKLTQTNHKIIALGSHPGILQSMMDYDFLCGKESPDLVGVVASGKKFLRLFWGNHEKMIPVYSSIESIPSSVKNDISLFINLSSGRRTMSSTIEAVDSFPSLMGGTLFAENMPEKNTLEIVSRLNSKDAKHNQFIVGPASVGLLIPGILKLGAIGGVQARQLIDGKLLEKGNVAVFSSSGGMTNELLNLVTGAGKRVSFALSFGGDRFPIVTPLEAFMAAEKDTSTEYIVYFGELGGYDEYDLVELIKKKKITKKVIAYIGGTISEMFETPPQFGHAKAMAARGEETAQAKRKALRSVGVKAADSFTEFIQEVKKITITNLKVQDDEVHSEALKRLNIIQNRSSALFLNSVSHDKGGSVEIIGEDLLSLAQDHSFGYVVGSMLLGRPLKSKETAECIDLIMKLLVDHGPYVSGAVNTMISARAGKDLVSSLASGLLTIGPRFGGAINQAASHWIEGVSKGSDPFTFVEGIAKKRGIISGIGHKKYRVDAPDPRVKVILSFVSKLKKTPYVDFAQGVEKVTTAKKGNLILNVDGAIAAVLLDLLSQKEKLSANELRELVETEFFNAFFVLSRAVGFTAHYLDQRRHDEGLFRLSPKEVGFTE